MSEEKGFSVFSFQFSDFSFEFSELLLWYDCLYVIQKDILSEGRGVLGFSVFSFQRSGFGGVLSCGDVWVARMGIFHD